MLQVANNDIVNPLVVPKGHNSERQNYVISITE